ncbi:MAG: 7-cyano-7-deazaguanine synthase QueC [Candidatus Methanomethyliaceae archaeon]|nr:7-cyano-7-deazaguanine synthase QueC [Candidatus Methanomethyliaceae archaeon]MDW7970744.1 7-cyano-7-deazaguanine synthase QueC [Nitrososphaerota archaeon]
MKRAIVIFSGGPDSTTLLYLTMRRGYEVHPITFNYGQLAKKELEAAERISNLLGLKLKIIDLNSLRELFLGITSLVDERIPITEGFSKQLIVPFRNGIMLSIAIAYAQSMGAKYVFYGAQGSDVPFYPDCRPKFIKAFQRSARLGTDDKLIIRAPLIKMRKSEVIRLGSKLGVPFELTWSCYRNGERHCGICESCINRKRAFMEAGIRDPTEYEI